MTGIIVEKLMKIKFDSEPIYGDNDKYIKTKIKIYADSMITNFQGIGIIHFVTTTAAFTCFNTKRIKYRLVTININNLWSYFTFLISH